MKRNFDKNTKVRSFKFGDQVLALLPIPGRPLQARDFWLVGCFVFSGPLRQYFILYRDVSQREGEEE